MQVEQHVGEPGARQHVALDAALRTDEERCERRVLAHQRTRDGQAGIEMSTGPAAGEPHPSRPGHHAGLETSGSVALTPYTRSRSLPMFTRMPVIAMVSTRLDRPYDTNGKVRPVLGNRPITTPT